MGIALLISIPIVMSILNKIDRHSRVKNIIGSTLAQKGNSDFYYCLYRKLRKFGLTRGYVDRLSRYYEMICPCDDFNIAKKTIITSLYSWFLCSVAIILIFIKNMNFSNTAISIMLVYVINTEIVGFMISNTENKLMEEISLFFSRVRHNFYIKYMVDDAILLSCRDIKSYEMRVHANKLYEIVTASDVKEAVIHYNTTMYNKYLKMFLSLCVNVLEYSDRVIKEQSLFITNLDNLKKELDTERIKLKRLRFKFSGISFMTIAVCVPIDMIRNYGVSMVPELSSFYNGKGGCIYVAFTVMAALCIYLLNNQLKETKRQIPQSNAVFKWLERSKIIKKLLDNYSEKHYIRMLELKELLSRTGAAISARQLVLKRMFFALIAGSIAIIFTLFLHETNKGYIVNETVLPNSISAVNSKQVNIIQNLVIRLVAEYKNNSVIDRNVLESRVGKDAAIYNTSVRNAIVDEIVIRIRKYNQEFFKWYELLICTGVSVFTYFVPYWMILYQKRVLQLSMEDEVNQLNSIIFMLMYCGHITVKDLLEEMEIFAVVFRQTIMECINEYNSGDIEAMERMKEKEAFGPFIRLTDNLIRCDSIAVYKAFDEIAADRENYHERRKLDNEISVQKRADRAQLLAWIPSVLVMIYLTIPLLVTSLEALSTFRDMMHSI